MIDPAERRRIGLETCREVMAVPVSAESMASQSSPYSDTLLDFVFAEVWNRPGLSRRDRRWITLACASAADVVAPIKAHVYAALKSGDIAFAEIQEFVLQFAVYCGWPKGSGVQTIVAEQWARLHEERGEAVPVVPPLPVPEGPIDIELVLQGGEQEFRDVNFVPAPPRDSPYYNPGILGFVFGHVWKRPGLSRRDRRWITLACVGLDDTEGPIMSHIYSAMKSGDISFEEMKEFALHFAVYYGWPKGSYVNVVIHEQWARVERERAESS